MFSNHFHKSIDLMKVITSINSTVKMYQFQRNELFAGQLSNTLMSSGDKPPLKDMIYLTFPE